MIVYLARFNTHHKDVSTDAWPPNCFRVQYPRGNVSVVPFRLRRSREIWPCDSPSLHSFQPYLWATFRILAGDAGAGNLVLALTH